MDSDNNYAKFLSGPVEFSLKAEINPEVHRHLMGMLFGGYAYAIGIARSEFFDGLSHCESLPDHARLWSCVESRKALLPNEITAKSPF